MVSGGQPVKPSPRMAWWWLAAAAVAVASYWPGLWGPFVFDDIPILTPVQAWARGELPLRDAILGQQSVLLARPLAMLTFVANAWASPSGTFAYKATNLVLHLACGLLAWQLARKLFALHASTSRYAEELAVVVAAVWLLHPFHASTVLYVVQRMMQLATLLTLLALLAYVKASTLPDSAGKAKASLLLFVIFPSLVGLGILAKQTAATAPLICIAIACAYFTHRLRDRRQQGFFLLFLGIPLLALATVLVTPARYALLAGYMDYDFSPGQRLMSQPGILLDYVGQLLLPRGASMGLYGDDVTAADGLLQPAWTLGSLATLSLITAGTVVFRRRFPAVLAGWLFFLAAHAVESSFLPLDLYFEHRNYLASFGILFALAGSAAPVFARLPRVAVSGAAVLLMAALAVSTHARARAWADKATLAMEGLAHHPDSLRAHLDALDVAMQRRDADLYLRLTAAMTSHANPEIALAGHAYRIPFQCLVKHADSTAGIERLQMLLPPRITLNDELSLRSLLSNGLRHCSPEEQTRIITAVSTAIDVAPKEARTGPRYVAIQRVMAQVFFARGERTKALAHQREAWRASGSIDDLIGLAELQAGAGDPRSAQATLRDAVHRGACASPPLRDRVMAVATFIGTPTGTSDRTISVCATTEE